jgi:hypothetical protein
LAKGKGDELARYHYQEALLTDCLPLEMENECLKRLTALTASIVFDPRRNHVLGVPKAVFHRVVPGDSLYRIGKQYGVAMGMLCRVNRLDPNGVIEVGRTLKVLTGPVTAHVDRWRLTATLLAGGAFIGRYPICIGPGDQTPAGTFTVRKKLVNPDWYCDGKRLPFGDPRNILGTRWLGFDPEENGGLGAGLGLHGTTLPESVPGRESKGCVRMLNAHVEEVYDFAPVGAKVIVN